MQLTITNNRAKTDRKPGPQVYSIFTQLEGRKNFAKADGCLSFEASQHNISLFLSVFPDTKVVEDQSEKFEGVAPVGDRPGFRFKREPQPHQQSAFDKLSDKDLWAVFGDTGTGKSFVLTTLAANAWSEGRIDAIILVCINKLVYDQWHRSQLPRDIPDNFPYKSWPWGKTKTDKQAYEDLKNFDGLQIVCMNIDAIRTPDGDKLLTDFIQHHKGRVLFAVDESQTIKTPGKSRTNAAMKFGGMCALRAIMSGTPISKSLEDAWTQFKFLDERIIGVRYKTAFRSQYCHMGGWMNKEIVGHKNIEQFYQKIDPWTHRIAKEELGFQEIDDEFEFDLGPKELKHYKELKKTFMTQLDNGEFLTVVNAISSMLRLQQISNGFLVGEDDEVQWLEKSRLQALDALIETLSDDKLMVWCRFKKDAELLVNHFGKDCLDLSGNVDPAQRSANKDLFLTDRSKRFAIGTPKAAGTGVDGLQEVTNRAIYYSNSEHALDYWQSKARTLRMGGQKQGFYHHLVGRKTLDKKILRNLQSKQELSSMTLDSFRLMLEE